MINKINNLVIMCEYIIIKLKSNKIYFAIKKQGTYSLWEALEACTLRLKVVQAYNCLLNMINDNAQTILLLKKFQLLIHLITK